MYQTTSPTTPIPAAPAGGGIATWIGGPHGWHVGPDDTKEKALRMAIDHCRGLPRIDVIECAEAFEKYLRGQPQ